MQLSRFQIAVLAALSVAALVTSPSDAYGTGPGNGLRSGGGGIRGLKKGGNDNGNGNGNNKADPAPAPAPVPEPEPEPEPEDEIEPAMDEPLMPAGSAKNTPGNGNGGGNSGGNGGDKKEGGSGGSGKKVVSKSRANGQAAFTKGKDKDRHGNPAPSSEQDVFEQEDDTQQTEDDEAVEEEENIIMSELFDEVPEDSDSDAPPAPKTEVDEGAMPAKEEGAVEETSDDEIEKKKQAWKEEKEKAKGKSGDKKGGKQNGNANGKAVTEPEQDGETKPIEVVVVVEEQGQGKGKKKMNTTKVDKEETESAPEEEFVEAVDDVVEEEPTSDEDEPKTNNGGGARPSTEDDPEADAPLIGDVEEGVALETDGEEPPPEEIVDSETLSDMLGMDEVVEGMDESDGEPETMDGNWLSPGKAKGKGNNKEAETA